MRDIFQSAIESHKSGRLQDAEQLYKSVLATEPQHPHANHNLGVLFVSVGYPADALPLLRIALDQDSTVNQFWLSYVDALIKAGCFEMARVRQNMMPGRPVSQIKRYLLSLQL